jgi:polysaccharide biosynthesis transport protein
VIGIKGTLSAAKHGAGQSQAAMSKNFELLKLLQREPLKPTWGVTPESGPPATRTFIAPVARGEEHEWPRALRALRRHWRWSVVFAVAMSLCVVIAVLLMKPVYEPIAQIEVDPPGNELFSLNPGSPSDSVAYAETQAKSLETDQLAVAVIRKLHLDHNRDFVDVPLRVGQSVPTPTDPSGGQLDVTPTERRALRVFRRLLQVHRDTSSWLINVSFASHDSKLAALITNTVVEQFIETNYKNRHDSIMQSTQWLSHQLDDIRESMEQSRQALADFQKNSGITPVGNAQNTFDENMSEVNRQLTVAQGDRIQLEALLEKVNGGDTVPHINADPVAQELSKRLAAARADLNQALTLYGKNHPRITALQAQIGELQARLEAQQRSILTDLKTNFAAAHIRENLLHSELKEATKQSGQMAEYEALKKEAQANEALYNALYAKVKEAGISAESKSSNVRWVDHAEVLDIPTRPHPLMDIAMGMLAGIVGGILLAFVLESLDSKVRTLEDMQTLTGSSVSPVPILEATIGKLKEKNILRWGRNNSVGSPEAFLLERPCSAEAEALRGLFSAVCVSLATRPPQVLLVASALPAEGKTTIAVNLGITIARHGKTCIVDADLRKASVASIFGFESRYGLVDVLNRSCALNLTLMPVPRVPNLTLLPGGAVQVGAGELICSEAMRDLMLELRQQFQFIIVDSPPILPYADARGLASLVDGVILVGRSGVTTREAVKRSLELLEQVQSAPVLDVVLNGVDFNSSGYPYNYGYAHK